MLSGNLIPPFDVIFVPCVSLQHVTDLSGKETMARVTGMVPCRRHCLASFVTGNMIS